jgi:hypothetical protein
MGGEKRGEESSPSSFSNLDAALDEELNSVVTVSYHGDGDTGRQFRQSPPEMI